MTSYYHHAQPSLRHNTQEQPSKLERLIDQSCINVGSYAPSLSKPKDLKNGIIPRSLLLENWWKLRVVFDLRLGLTFLWILTLIWGEELTFKRNVKACAWNRWESWVGADCLAPHLQKTCPLRTSLVSERNSTSRHSARGPSNSRSSHLSRSALAALYPYSPTHRSVPPEIFSAASKLFNARYGDLSGRPV